MHVRAVCFVLGVLLVCIGASFILPVGVSLWFKDGAARSLLICMAGICAAGLVLALPNRPSRDVGMSARQGFAVVGLCWVAAGFAGGVPYMLCGGLGLTDAVFESVSGFTTTGATILSDIEALPKGLLMWRSLTHWLGGLGIIVLTLIVLPLLGVGGMQLYRAEASGPHPGKLTPRMRDTALALWKIYLLLTALETVLLMAAGMDWFDAINHAFSTLATGGFSTRNNSIAAFPGAAIQWIIIVFMFLAGMRFSLHYAFLKGNFRAYSSSTENLSYIWMLLSCTVIVSALLALRGTFPLRCLADLEYIVRACAFQLVSLCTTTGFVSENYTGWPSLALGIFLLLTFLGGCTGSTAGGLKCMRAVVLLRAAYGELFRLLHPHSVRSIKLRSGAVSPEVLSGIVNFFILYVLVTLAACFALAAQEIDLATAFTASLTCVSNVGPGLGRVGPVDNFGWMPAFSKWVLSLAMLMGRLEFYALLIMFVPEFWKK